MGAQPTSATRLSDVVRLRADCRLCGDENITNVWSFGTTPLANSYLSAEEIGQPEVFAPLEVGVCAKCHLVQLRHVVDPKVLFDHYLYVSSTSPSFVRHFEEYATTLIERFKLSAADLVVDVGSNDGILLKPLQRHGIKVLGIEPAHNIATVARREGVPTISKFFTPELAQGLVKKNGQAKIITANNVFAHTDDVGIFVASVKELLATDGAFVFEVQYLGDLVAKNLFDIVYHEHLCYYHLQPLVAFFQSQGMKVFDVERPAVHGGSLRVYVEHDTGPYPVHRRVSALLAKEATQGLNTVATYQAFAQRITANKQELLTLLKKLKNSGQRIVGYGAPAKATTLLYAFGIDGTLIDYIVDDDTKFKQGRFMPGTHIPIVSPDALYTDQPQYCLILAWNFSDTIMKNHQRFQDQGGHFIVPVPKPAIITS